MNRRKRHVIGIAAAGIVMLLSASARADLVDYYEFEYDGFDLQTGGIDSAGGDANGLVGDNVTFGLGPNALFGQAMIVGSSGYATEIVQIPQADAFDPGMSDFTMAFWVKRDNVDSGNPDGVMDCLSGTTSGWALFFRPTNYLGIRLDELHDGSGSHSVEFDSSVPITDSDWHHYAITVDRGANVAKLYIDGEFNVSQGIWTLDSAISPSQALNIGTQNTQGLEGSLDDLRFYNVALSEEEVENLANAVYQGDPGDCDPDGGMDGDIDLRDFWVFTDCMTSADVWIGLEESACFCSDFDGDFDGDVLDFAEFQLAFNRPYILTVPVGNPGNPGELSGTGAGGIGPDRICGAVDYEFDIQQFPVTAWQYTVFLNHVAADDPYGLYHESMDTHDWGCQIERHGAPGSYWYSVHPDQADRPVNYVNWGDTVRFANWLHNGMPYGAQDLTTTEDGSYFLNGATGDGGLVDITREPDATWVVPSEDEWYKAAYHYNDGPTGNYYDYATSSDTPPSHQLIDPDPGNNATISGGVGVYTLGPPIWRTEVGAHENTVSPYGAYDLAGNVWEWNDTYWWTGRYGIRGGSFESTAGYGHAFYRYSQWPEHGVAPILGFRVAELP